MILTDDSNQKFLTEDTNQEILTEDSAIARRIGQLVIHYRIMAYGFTTSQL